MFKGSLSLPALWRIISESIGEQPGRPGKVQVRDGVDLGSGDGGRGLEVTWGSQGLGTENIW